MGKAFAIYVVCGIIFFLIGIYVALRIYNRRK